MKRAVIALYILVVVCIAVATIVEKNSGTGVAHEMIYGAWWFTLLWAALAGCGIFYFIKRRVRRVYAVGLHLSLVIILAGALLTHLTSKQGRLHLRVGETATMYRVNRYVGEGRKAMRKLHFQIELKSFDIVYHEGTTTAADYRSKFTIRDGNMVKEDEVSMNNIFSYKSIRLYQLSYDEDLQGSTLSVNSDPYGIPVTYCGYTLLFLSLIWMLVDPKGAFRKLLGSPLLKRGALVVAALFALNVSINASPKTFPKEIAEEFGKLNILYNGRICPIETFALDFTKKIYGARSYKGLTATQVVTGWLFWSDEWSNEEFIKVKGKGVREKFNTGKHASVNHFFVEGAYVLGPYIKEYYSGNSNELMKQAAEVDKKLELVLELRRGSPIKAFPYTFKESHARTHTDDAVSAGTTLWYGPTDATHYSIDNEQRLFIKNVFKLIEESAKKEDYEAVKEILGKIAKYQEANAGGSLPSAKEVWAEKANNAVPYSTLLFMVNLTLGFIALVYTIRLMTGKRRVGLLDVALPLLTALSFIVLTFALALRWIISGNVPMSNGYETMLIVAWFVEIISLLMFRRVRIVLVFGLLLSGFFLLVSHINQMDPAIGKMMPVLNSPLLSIHVSFIMMSYALCSLTFVCGITGLCLRSHEREMQVLSRIFLYPAITMMGFGIFIGAIWANQSWGVYWSWDPKETWALITLLIYAVPMHTGSIRSINKPVVYHAYMVAAFLSILMTYFGVNFILGGMHSYA